MVLGMAACVLVAVAAYRVAADGLSAVADGWELAAALVFLVPVGAGALMGLRSLLLQLRSSRRLERRISGLTAQMPADVEAAATRTGLLGRVRMVGATDSFSFVYGALSPRVVVSRGLADHASASELAAVLEHERYHVRNLDPLKVIVVRTIEAALFYVPALRAPLDRYIAGRELAADRHALDTHGRGPLAGALLKVVRAPSWEELQTAAAIGGPELLDVRIAQLESGAEPPLGGASPTRWALSGIGLVAPVAAFVVAVAAYGGPSAVAQAMAPGASFGAVDVFMCLACATPLVVVGWVGWRWLSTRASRPLDAPRRRSSWGIVERVTPRKARG
jgi:TRAP-type C4-dicarboxylate transport system permease small subunit